MEKKGVFTKILAIIGTLLVWFPLLAPVLFSMIRLIGSGMFRFDYLMPLELFPVVLVGGGLLLWAALRALSRRRLIGWSLGITIGLLFATQLYAVLTGLASGETEAVGWIWVFAMILTMSYPVALVVVGVGGVLLLRDLFRPSKS